MREGQFLNFLFDKMNECLYFLSQVEVLFFCFFFLETDWLLDYWCNSLSFKGVVHTKLNFQPFTTHSLCQWRPWWLFFKKKKIITTKELRSCELLQVGQASFLMLQELAWKLTWPPSACLTTTSQLLPWRVQSIFWLETRCSIYHTSRMETCYECLFLFSLCLSTWPPWVSIVLAIDGIISICDTPGGFCGWEKVTRVSIFIVVSRECVKFQFRWTIPLSSCLNTHTLFNVSCTNSSLTKIIS